MKQIYVKGVIQLLRHPGCGEGVRGILIFADALPRGGEGGKDNLTYYLNEWRVIFKKVS